MKNVFVAMFFGRVEYDMLTSEGCKLFFILTANHADTGLDWRTKLEIYHH